MREILFRGKWIGNGKWVEGYYCKISETTYAFAEDYERNPIPVHHYILQEAMTDWGLPNRFNQYEIDPKTLCQYTGLKDKNGKRIWENDIVSGKFNYEKIIGIICYGSNAHYYIERKGMYGIHLDNSEDWLNIVGNIFDNPELLKGGLTCRKT